MSARLVATLVFIGAPTIGWGAIKLTAWLVPTVGAEMAFIIVATLVMALSWTFAVKIVTGEWWWE